MLKKIKNFIFKNKKLEGLEDIPKWRSNQCYYCGKDASDGYWRELMEINGERYSVAVCDKCSPPCTHKVPTLKDSLEGDRLEGRIN